MKDVYEIEIVVYIDTDKTLEVTISKNGSYYDHDEDDFELSEI